MKTQECHVARGEPSLDIGDGPDEVALDTGAKQDGVLEVPVEGTIRANENNGHRNNEENVEAYQLGIERLR